MPWLECNISLHKLFPLSLILPRLGCNSLVLCHGPDAIFPSIRLLLNFFYFAASQTQHISIMPWSKCSNWVVIFFAKIFEISSNFTSQTIPFLSKFLNFIFLTYSLTKLGFQNSGYYKSFQAYRLAQNFA